MCACCAPFRPATQSHPRTGRLTAGRSCPLSCLGVRTSGPLFCGCGLEPAAAVSLSLCERAGLGAVLDALGSILAVVGTAALARERSATSLVGADADLGLGG